MLPLRVCACVCLWGGQTWPDPSHIAFHERLVVVGTISLEQHVPVLYGKENRKYEKEIRKSIPSDKPNRNKTGRGMPVSYRDSYEKDRDDVIQSKIRQGKGSFKDLGKKK